MSPDVLKLKMCITFYIKYKYFAQNDLIHQGISPSLDGDV